MSKQIKKRLVPTLRFPEFRNAGEWVSDELGGYTNKVGSGITPNGGDKNYKTSGRPFVRSQNVGWGNLILDDVAYIDEETHSTFLGTEIANNDVLLNITGASIGRCAVADEKIAGGNVNQHVCIIRTKPKKLNPLFLNQFILSSVGQKQIDSFQAGGNRQGLNFAQIRSFEIPLPPEVEEQQKIADCLSSIDKLITAEGQKLETLKTHKKGLMQQLFPANGETVPKLRFSEFRDAGEWEEHKLETLCFGISSGKDKSDPEGCIDLYGSTGVIGKTSEPSYAGSYLLVARVGANAGLLTRANGEFGVTDNTLVIDLKDSENIEFIHYSLLNFNLNKLTFGSGQPLITGSQIKDLRLRLAEPEEQKKIAECLTSIDELIANQTENLENFLAHKNGLTHQLFPTMNEVNV